VLKAFFSKTLKKSLEINLLKIFRKIKDSDLTLGPLIPKLP
jgi:hypothetical protein